MSTLNLNGDLALEIFNALRGKCECKVCKGTKELVKIKNPKERFDKIKQIVTIALKEPSVCGLGNFFKVNHATVENWVKNGKSDLK